MKILIIVAFILITNRVPAQINTIDTLLGTTGLCKNTLRTESNFWNVIQNRRSVRKFLADSIPVNDIMRIIDAARMAPTSGNQQPWKFIVLKDKKKINQIKEACIREYLDEYDQRNNNKKAKEQFKEKITKRLNESYFSAPVFIIVLTYNNSLYPAYNHWDGPLAAGYLMLAARSLGYGTVFITDAISEKITKDVLKIPENFTRVCITPLGIPYEWPKTPSKKEIGEFILWE